MKRSAILLVLCAFTQPLCGEIPANAWTQVNEGSLELGPFYPSLIGCKLVHVEPMKSLAIVPGFAKQETGYRVMSLEDPKWTSQPGSAPKNLLPTRMNSPKAYCYLPGLKKILVMKGKWSYSRSKTPVGCWLMDPADGTWEPILPGLRMTDKSVDFELAPGKDGLALPAWGTLCYDAHNKEALSFGGGAVWGRVAKEKSKVAPGDWIYDEGVKRCRRLTVEDEGKVTQARRWFPAHCGTWTFSEATRKWKALEQPLHEQPYGRILPGMAYDGTEKKIVLFGGDDLARCMNDTWVYDCRTRTWREIRPPVSPTARAGHAMVYVPEAGAVLLVGGYAGGWKGLKDVWLFHTAGERWERLSLDLPVTSCYASGVYLPERKAVYTACYPSSRRNKKVPVYALKLDPASVSRTKPQTSDPKLAYHCKAKRRPTDLPGEWLTGKGAPGPEGEVLARIKSFPPNTWKNMKPPKLAPERNWGSYVYDIRTHKGFAWGGGHSAYPGAEISTYDLETNRWRGMAEPTNYNPVWLHGMVGGPPGLSFGGWSLLPSHARKSYGVDPLSDSVITYAGDVFSIKHRSVVAHIGKFPMNWGGPSYQVAYVTTPHGLYAFAAERSSRGSGWLCRANVAAGKWDAIDKTGPKPHHENDFLAYDSKRDRILHFKWQGAVVHAFDFRQKKWSKEEAAGGKPAVVVGDATYVPEMDAVLTVFATKKGGPESLYFYRCDERKWYTAPSVGDPFRGVNLSRNWSPVYDPELKIVVRFTPTGFHQWVNVHIMRLETASLELTALKTE